MAGFLWYVGIFYCVTTSVIALFKREKNPVDETKADKLLSTPTKPTKPKKSSILDSYEMAFNILRIPSIQKLALALLTVKFAWAACEGVSFLKFLNSGISNERMIPMYALFQLPFQTIIIVLVGKYAAIPKTAQLYIIAIPLRAFSSLLDAGIIWITPYTIPESGVAPGYICYVYLANSIFNGLIWATMAVTLTAIFVKISDPAVGETYMTLTP